MIIILSNGSLYTLGLNQVNSQDLVKFVQEFIYYFMITRFKKKVLW